jgi:hypothetical protein
MSPLEFFTTISTMIYQEIQSAYLLTPPSKKPAHDVAAANHPIETAHRPATEEGATVMGKTQAVTTLASNEQFSVRSLFSR